MNPTEPNNGGKPEDNQEFSAIIGTVRVIDRKRLEEHLKDFIWLIPTIAKLLGRLIGHPKVSTGNKVLLGLGVAYMLSPIDLIPDFIPILGQLDDLAVVGIVLNKLFAETDADIIRECWDGDPAGIDEVHKLCRAVNDLLKSKLHM